MLCVDQVDSASCRVEQGWACEVSITGHVHSALMRGPCAYRARLGPAPYVMKAGIYPNTTSLTWKSCLGKPGVQRSSGVNVSDRASNK